MLELTETVKTLDKHTPKDGIQDVSLEDGGKFKEVTKRTNVRISLAQAQDRKLKKNQPEMVKQGGAEPNA